MQEKWVRIMFDYSSSGVWERGGANIEESELPITLELQKRIIEWINSYDTHAWGLLKFDSYGSNETSWSEEELEQELELSRLCLEDFKEGVRIAVEIKKQLPDWTVVVYNDSKGILMLPENERRNSEIPMGWEAEFA